MVIFICSVLYSTAACRITTVGMASLASRVGAQERIADTILGFLEAAIHVILFVRDVYPAEIFEPRSKYGISLQMSRHPELNSYIAGILSTLRQHIIEGTVTQISVVIQDHDLRPREKFNFDIVVMGGTTQGLYDGDAACDALRALLQKLCVADASLLAPPKDATFVVLAFCKGFPDEMQHKWIQQAPATSAPPANARVVPLRSADLGSVAIQLLVVQAAPP